MFLLFLRGLIHLSLYVQTAASCRCNWKCSCAGYAVCCAANNTAAAGFYFVFGRPFVGVFALAADVDAVCRIRTADGFAGNVAPLPLEPGLNLTHACNSYVWTKLLMQHAP